MAGSYRIAALVGADLGAGFSLAGVDVITANGPAQALELLRDSSKSRSWGIIIVDESLLEGVDEREKNAFFERTIPLVITIPGAMHWVDLEKGSSDDFVARLIRRAVGYQLNIQV